MLCVIVGLAAQPRFADIDPTQLPLLFLQCLVYCTVSLAAACSIKCWLCKSKGSRAAPHNTSPTNIRPALQLVGFPTVGMRIALTVLAATIRRRSQTVP